VGPEVCRLSTLCDLLVDDSPPPPPWPAAEAFLEPPPEPSIDVEREGPEVLPLVPTALPIPPWPRLYIEPALEETDADRVVSPYLRLDAAGGGGAGAAYPDGPDENDEVVLGDVTLLARFSGVLRTCNRGEPKPAAPAREGLGSSASGEAGIIDEGVPGGLTAKTSCSAGLAVFR